jgi:hypothetical protein
MSVPRSVAQVLNEHVTLEVELAKELKLERLALLQRIVRLNKKAYGPCLISERSSAGTQYSTVDNAMIRQPAIAVVVLLFDSTTGYGLASPGDLEKFAIERYITDVDYCLDYLIERRYFIKRGEEFGPGRRLSVEKKYINLLALKWPVQEIKDRLEIDRCRNEVLWLVWKQEEQASGIRQTTHDALVVHCVLGSSHRNARQLAEFAIRVS